MTARQQQLLQRLRESLIVIPKDEREAGALLTLAYLGYAARAMSLGRSKPGFTLAVNGNRGND